MKKIVDRLTSFVLDHIHGIAAAIGGVVIACFSFLLGKKSGKKESDEYYQAELIKTRETIRKCKAELAALKTEKRKDKRRIKELEATVKSGVEYEKDLERKLGIK